METAIEQRACVICGGVFERRPQEPMRHFQKRKTCSSVCIGQLRSRMQRVAPDQKDCMVCGQSFQRRDDERIEHFRNRESCSEHCKAQLISQRKLKGQLRRTTRWRYPEDRRCVVCGNEITQRPDELKGNTATRMTCSDECYRIRRNIHDEPGDRSCGQCGKPMKRRANECVAEYIQRKFCGRDCASTARRFSTVMTSIEKQVAEALNSLSMKFCPQVSFGRYTVDFWIPEHETVIECYGDFWHANPRIYPDRDNLSFLQTKNVERDMRRVPYILSRCNRVIVLWESDIHQFGALALITRELGIVTKAAA